MKNIRYILMAVLAAFCMTSCEWFLLDNTEQHNATVSGKIIDAATGETVQTEINNGGSIRFVELGWDAESFQSWSVKNNGTYRNNLVWAGDYRMETIEQNCYPLTQEFKLEKGDNVVDFTVTPYLRFLSHSIKYDAASKKIIATCEVQVSDPSKTDKINEIRLCCFTDCFVGYALNNCKNDAGAAKKNVTMDANGKATVTLEIDTQDSANAIEFKYERTHYVRLAAVATGSGVNTSSRYNFTPTYSIRLDGSEPVLYDKW
jgi:hypothetical protein